MTLALNNLYFPNKVLMSPIKHPLLSLNTHKLVFIILKVVTPLAWTVSLNQTKFHLSRIIKVELNAKNYERVNIWYMYQQHFAQILSNKT